MRKFWWLLLLVAFGCGQDASAPDDHNHPEGEHDHDDHEGHDHGRLDDGTRVAFFWKEDGRNA